MAEKQLSQAAQWDHEFVWHPFTQMQDWLAQEPVVIERGEGVYLIDENGKKYYDGVSSLWVNIHGHNHPVLNQALKEQVDKIAHSTLLGLVSPPSAQLCKELVELAPEGLNKVFLSDDGSTAIEVAIKMAYQYRQLVGQTKKTKFIALNAGYHGDTLGTVSVGGIQLFHQVFHNLLFKPLTLPSPGVYRDLADRDKAFDESLAELERILNEEGNEITALVMEPLVQAAAGMLVMPHGYLKRVRELTAKHDVFLIVDEVATGFGRTGRFFACEHEDVAPDFMTLSKGITGGYMPLAATLTTQRIFDAFLGTFEEKKTFYHGHSYTGNALACAVALASLKVFRDEKVIEGLPKKIEAFTNALKPIEKLKHVKEVRQRGLIVGIELEKDVATHEAYRPNDAVGAKVAILGREQGLICRPIGDVVILMPPLASTVEQLEDMVRIVGESIQRATEEEEILEDLRPIIL